MDKDTKVYLAVVGGVVAAWGVLLALGASPILLFGGAAVGVATGLAAVAMSKLM